MTEPTSDNSSSVQASAGEILLEERRRKGMSLGDVSRQLKLSVRQIEAIEGNDFKWLGGVVFVHGFLRNYAKLLDLDPETVIRRADSALKQTGAAAPDAKGSASRPAQPEKSGKLVWMVAALLLVAGSLTFLGRKPDPAVPLVPEVASAPDTAQPADLARAGPAAQVSKATAHTRMTSVPDKKMSSDSETAVVVRGPPVPKLSVRMEFDQESWVEIRDRHGEIVLSRLNFAGGAVRASGEPPLSVVVGNAAGVRFFKGTTPVDLAPYIQVDVARLTLE